MAELNSVNGNKHDEWIVERSPKKSFRRSRSGCMTCRIRKIKCDEAKPACMRCVSTGRKCDGYSKLVQSKPAPAPVALLLVPVTRHPDLDAQSRFSIEYFRAKSALTLRNHDTQSFWSGVVLAAAETEQCIRDLVIAASCLDEATSAVVKRNSITIKSTYLTHHGRALRSLAHTKDLRLMIIACIILILCADYEQGPYVAITHIQSGRAMIESVGNIQRDDFLLDLKSIIDLLWQHSPELSARDNSIFRPPFSQDLPVRGGTSVVLKNHSVEGFSSVTEAAKALEALVPQCITKTQRVRPPLTRFHTVPGITEKLNHWLQQLNELVRHLDNHSDFVSYVKTHILRAYHLILVIVCRCEDFGSERLFDTHVNDLDGLTKKLHLFSEVGTGNSLKSAIFWVICKSRDAAGRRDLTNLLRYQACGLDGVFLAEVAETVIRVEEYGLDNPITSDDIPESHRVCVKGLSQSAINPVDQLVCQMYSNGQTIGTRLVPLNYYNEEVRSTGSAWKAQVLSDALNLRFEL